MSIQSFKDKKLAKVFARQVPKGFPADLGRVTFRKLIALDNAQSLDELRAPPSNHLEALAGDRAGQHSIRINDQFRLCFVWSASGPDQVEFTDYH